MTTVDKKVAVTDIDDLFGNDEAVTYRVPVEFDEEGNEKSGFIIVGKNSQEYQDVTKEIRIENVMKASRIKGADGSTPEGAAIIINSVLTNEDRIAKAIVKDWFGFSQKGNAVPFDSDYLGTVFAKRPQYRAKILGALEIDANFTKK